MKHMNLQENRGWKNEYMIWSVAIRCLRANVSILVSL